MSIMQCASQCIKEIDAIHEGKADEYQASLQNTFYENKSLLQDYNLSLDNSSSSDIETERKTSAERIDIKAKFQYANVTFLELITRMEAAIQEKETILGSRQPHISRWWWNGAILKMRFLVSL